MMHAPTLTPAQAGALAARVRLLRRQRLLTAHQAALADVLLWSARKPGSGLLTASLTVLARLAGQARSTVIEGVRRLEELGLIQRIKRRACVTWGGSVASRVIANGYRLLAPDTETGRRSGREEPLRISILETPMTTVRAAQEALERRRRAVQRAMLDKQETRRCQTFA